MQGGCRLLARKSKFIYQGLEGGIRQSCFNGLSEFAQVGYPTLQKLSAS